MTVNGIRCHFDDAEVESVTFDGGDGYNKIILDDSIAWGQNTQPTSKPLENQEFTRAGRMSLGRRSVSR